MLELSFDLSSPFTNMLQTASEIGGYSPDIPIGGQLGRRKENIMSEIPVTRDPVCGREVNSVATRVVEQTKEAQ
jgi:hypothetical protein